MDLCQRVTSGATRQRVVLDSLVTTDDKLLLLRLLLLLEARHPPAPRGPSTSPVPTLKITAE
jgi:hypothetical protein